MTKFALLSGADGFIGVRVAKALGDQGIATMNVPDVLKPVRLDRPPVGIIHLAAVSRASEFSADLHHAYTVNLQGTLNMLEVARRWKCRFFLASSSAVYGESKARRIPESAPIRPIASYGRSKRMAELMCEDFSRTQGVSTMALRFFNIYGPGQRSEFFIPHMVESVIKRKPLELRYPRAERDYLHVDDVGRLFLALLRRPFEGFRVFNVGSGVGRTVRSALSEAERIIGRKAVWKQATAVRDEASRAVADIRALRSFALWAPAIGFKDGLRSVIDDYRARHGAAVSRS